MWDAVMLTVKGSAYWILYDDEEKEKGCFGVWMDGWER